MTTRAAHSRLGLDGAADGKARLYFWGDRVLYLGPGFEATMHAHHAVQICIELAGELWLRGGPDEHAQRYRGVLIPPDVQHQGVGVADFLGVLFLDADSNQARRLPRGERAGRMFPIAESHLERIVPLLWACWDTDFPAPQAAGIYESVMHTLADAQTSRPPVDSRVARAMQLLQAAPDRRIPLDRVAEAVSLSSSRLRHLFHAETGIPFRRYVLWLRLQDAVRTLGHGATLTDAAHAAGFADSAHLSRTFRRMLGFPPSALLAVSRFVQVRD